MPEPHDPLCLSAEFACEDCQTNQCICDPIREARAEQDKKWARNAADDARTMLDLRRAQELAVMVVKADCKRRLDEARAELRIALREEKERITDGLDVLPWHHNENEEPLVLLKDVLDLIGTSDG